MVIQRIGIVMPLRRRGVDEGGYFREDRVVIDDIG